MRMKLIVATQNKKKLQEIKDILRGYSVEIFSLLDVTQTPRIIENGKTFQENAIKKAVIISRKVHGLVLGEDSGLCIDALDGRPGVYSARFAGSGKDDKKNNRKVLRLLRNLPLRKRAAGYVCAVALAERGRLVKVVQGECRGRIAFEPRGSRGFGYDPLFLIPRYNKTFAQLGEGVKHTMSHRFRALKKAVCVIEKYIEQQGRS